MKRIKVGLLLAVGLTALLAGCNFLVDSSAPKVAFMSPSNNTVSPQSTQVVVVASDDDSGIASITLSLNGRIVSTANGERDEEGSYSLDAKTLTYNWDASTTSGENTLVAEAKNGFGRTAQTEPMIVIVTKPSDPDSPDTEDPTVRWISPSDGDNVSGVLALAAAATDDKGVTKVEFLAGNTVLFEDTQAPYSYEWDTVASGRSDGSVTLTARAYDAVGQFGEAGISVELLNSGVPPTLSVIKPNEGNSVGVQFEVEAEIIKQQADFSWVLDRGHKLWAKVYDYRGNLVKEAYLTDDGSDNSAEPTDNEDFTGSRPFDLGSVPADTYQVVVEGTVRVNGKEIKLSRRNTFDVVINSNLPPALVVSAPLSQKNTNGKPVLGDRFSVSGRVTDDSGEVHALEFRMVCDNCGPDGEPINNLLHYIADPYDWFSSQTIRLNGTPYSNNSEDWKIRVVAVDAANTTIRNIQEIEVDINRNANYGAFANAPFTVVEGPDGTKIQPGSATWTLDLSGTTNPVYYVLNVFKNTGSGPQLMASGDGTLQAGESLVHPQSFGSTDEGSWHVEAILQDTVTNVHYPRRGPSVGVERLESP